MEIFTGRDGWSTELDVHRIIRQLVCQAASPQCYQATMGERLEAAKKLYLEIKHFDLCRKVSVCHFSSNVKPGYTGPIQSIQSNNYKKKCRNTYFETVFITCYCQHYIQLCSYSTNVIECYVLIVVGFSY